MLRFAAVILIVIGTVAHVWITLSLMGLRTYILFLVSLFLCSSIAQLGIQLWKAGR